LAGDVPKHLHPVLGRIRVEHYNSAARHGAAAARAMLGSVAPFDYLHNFWSDQYEHILQYVGHATSWDDFAVRGGWSSGAATASLRRRAGSILPEKRPWSRAVERPRRDAPSSQPTLYDPRTTPGSSPGRTAAASPAAIVQPEP
jgi:Reductase C-terminal